MDEILKYLPLVSPLSVFLWFLIRKEMKAQIAKARDEFREYVDSKIKEAKEESNTLFLREHSRIERLSERMMELEKTHTMEIALLRQTASTTDKRLDTIETRIEKLDSKFDEKFDEQKELLHKIHAKFQNGGSPK
ncbi:hypothetical protein FH581_021880 [Leptospira weilii]|uniref:hypothetical protein n=1 Tax=Leptospira weilii TaxID=28184 RepID=UPI001EF323B5|nr:hypothetical protein [Leptospira weilii]ULH28703.1 hypothetical protein FH586_20860 [Leptospira weilii]ULH28770.1 hypothetical protein FH586_02120 [Leptospira weilii]ULH30043.1 hypothetical protein FH586_09415 [Leptospira weilii]UPY76790.1 hypothetical protein FH581_012595 [Leptospira weilii]UPY79597.1 hypothetical protein FH581_015425 [Leptospira weilii]